MKRAAARKRSADAEYRAALLSAHDGGVAVAELARMVGVSRQAMQQQLDRWLRS